MLVLLLIVLGLIFICLCLVSILALLDDEFRGLIESSAKALLYAGTQQGMEMVNKPVVHKPEVVREDSMVNDYADAPSKWEPQLITERLRRVRNNPALLQYFFESFKDRLILGQDYRTSNMRIKFLQAQIQELNIAKEYLIALDNLNFHELEREIHHRELELKKEDLENRRIEQEEIRKLERERDALKIKVEMAQLNRQIKDIENG
jgi:hypothetical protein